MDKIISIFKKNQFEDIYIELVERKGEQLVDIRTWRLSQGSKRKMPTVKGITINIDDLSKLRESLDKVDELFF